MRAAAADSASPQNEESEKEQMGGFIGFLVFLGIISCGGYLIAKRQATNTPFKRSMNRAAEIWNRADFKTRAALLEKAGISPDHPSFRILMGSTWAQLDLNVSALLAVSFSPKKPAPRTYTDAGFALTVKLVSSLKLRGWDQGRPILNQEEAEAIQAGLKSLKGMANEAGGGPVVFRPDVSEEIQRRFGADALKTFADNEWKYRGELPATWKHIVSTYLKAWAMKLDPWVLIELSELLAKASYIGEAKEAAEIVEDLFPAYAPRYFAGAATTSEATNVIVATARELIQRL